MIPVQDVMPRPTVHREPWRCLSSVSGRGGSWWSRQPKRDPVL